MLHESVHIRLARSNHLHAKCKPHHHLDEAVGLGQGVFVLIRWKVEDTNQLRHYNHRAHKQGACDSHILGGGEKAAHNIQASKIQINTIYLVPPPPLQVPLSLSLTHTHTHIKNSIRWEWLALQALTTLICHSNSPSTEYRPSRVHSTNSIQIVYTRKKNHVHMYICTCIVK